MGASGSNPVNITPEGVIRFLAISKSWTEEFYWALLGLGVRSLRKFLVLAGKTLVSTAEVMSLHVRQLCL